MASFFRRAFDRSYFILAPAVLLTYFVPLRMRVGNGMVAPFLALWFLWIFLKGERAPYYLSRKFMAAFIPLALYYLLYAFLYGFHDWCGLTLQKTMLDGLLIVIYIYIFHYSVSRGKYKELLFLNAIICFALIYGSIAYASFEVGSYRGQRLGVGGETIEQTLNRLDRASSGVVNYGGIYGMMMMVVAMVRYYKFIPWKWRFVDLLLVAVFCFGIYRGAYSTATAVTVAGSIFVIFLNLIRIHDRKIHRLLIAFSVIFVICVAYPSVLSPLSGLFGTAAEAFPPESDYAIRLQSIAEALQGYEDTYAVQRADLYWGSLKTFCSHPIFGFRFYQLLFDENYQAFIGGHSYFFDAFAATGLVLPTLLVVGLVNFFRYLKAIYSFAGLSVDLLSVWQCAFWTVVIVACINQLGQFETHIIFYMMLPLIPFLNYKYHLRRNGYAGVRYFPANVPVV